MTTLTLIPSDLADLVLPTPRQLKRLGLSTVEFREACRHWQIGQPIFGYWASKHVQPWGVGPYGELVRLVRAALGDTADYSQELP